MSESIGLNENFDTQEFSLPDGEILRLHDSIAPEHRDTFKQYVLDKLKRDPWAQKIIEQEICTNFKAKSIIELGEVYNRNASLERMKAANDEKYS